MKYPCFLGVDIAGANNTWLAALELINDKITLVDQPTKISLKGIMEYVAENNVLAVTIDSQLTWSVTEENGFRSSDIELRNLLPPQLINCVASQNSMMAVPVRGRQLAEMISPYVGTIIETHPRACLYLNNSNMIDAIKQYKSDKIGNNLRQKYIYDLWSNWINSYNIELSIEIHDLTDGELDSLICATIGYLYHYCPGKLYKLKHTADDIRGRGSFYVINTKPLK